MEADMYTGRPPSEDKTDQVVLLQAKEHKRAPAKQLTSQTSEGTNPANTLISDI